MQHALGDNWRSRKGKWEEDREDDGAAEKKMKRLSLQPNRVNDKWTAVSNSNSEVSAVPGVMLGISNCCLVSVATK
jgi:hypothetical protein